MNFLKSKRNWFRKYIWFSDEERFSILKSKIEGDYSKDDIINEQTGEYIIERGNRITADKLSLLLENK